MTHIFARARDARARAAGEPDGAPLYSVPGPLGTLRALRRDRLAFVEAAWRACGPTARFDLGRLAGHLLTRPEDVRHVLVDHHANYTKATRGFEIIRMVLGQGLVTSEGELWRRQRRIIQPAFHRERIVRFGDTMSRCAEEMMDGWGRRAADGESFDLAAEFMKVTLRIITMTMFSADVEKEAARVGAALEVIGRFVNRTITNPLPLPLGVPTPTNVAFKRSLAELDSIVNGLVAERRAGKSGPGELHPEGDLLTMLLEARDADTGEAMSPRQLRDELMTIFLAGHETTSNALAWTFFFLSRHPDVARRLHAEVDAVLEGRPPTLDDLSRLSYTAKVVKESMRLRPPVWIIGRAAVEADVVGSARVPAGGLVFVSPWITHRDERYWRDPMRFDPERFSEEESAGRPRYAYFPFGGGPRLCIGQAFAEMEAKLITAAVAQRYVLTLVPGRPVVPQPVVTLRPRDGVWARASRR